MIKVNEISRSYGNLKAVDKVSFEIPRGQIVGLLGHNGAGKTTIMKMLTGYLESDAGSIEIAEKDLASNLISCQKKIGYLPENSPNYGELTVSEYLEFIAELKGSKNLRKDVVRVIEKVRLSERATQKIATLSKGYQQRVGVAQAILGEPEILIMDEPTNGLDPRQIREMRHLIKELSQNSTIIISTHILQEVEAICDRVLIMMGGKLVLDSQLSSLSEDNLIRLETDRSDLNFSEINGVTSVNCKQHESNLAYEIKFTKANSNLVDNIITSAKNQGAQIFAIAPEYQNLDSIFKKLENQI